MHALQYDNSIEAVWSGHHEIKQHFPRLLSAQILGIPSLVPTCDTATHTLSQYRVRKWGLVYTSELLTALMRSFSGARPQRAEQVLCVGLGECSERVLVATR